MGRSPLFKIKLASGRVLGPLDPERLAQLILNGTITGTEVGREYPTGDWKDVNQIELIRELLVQAAAGTLQKATTEGVPAAVQAGVPQALIPTVVLNAPAAGPTELPGAESASQEHGTLAPIVPRERHEELPSVASVPAVQMQEPPSAPMRTEAVRSDGAPAQEDRTVVASPEEFEKTIVAPIDDPPEAGSQASLELASGYLVPNSGPDSKVLALAGRLRQRSIANEKTVVFQRSKSGPGDGKGRRGLPAGARNLAVAILLGFMAYDLMYEAPAPKTPAKWVAIKPSLPAYVQGKSSPQQSVKLYGEAMRDYVQDTVVGYRDAAAKLRLSAGEDITNVKALAMLASSYINLIDSSNKDENYFSVISKLIDMSRAKNVETEETVIADVEFYLVVNKAEAAQNRIVDFTKNHQFGTAMFYYIALTFLHRGDAPSASRYATQIPDKSAFSAKVFVLKGAIAEALGDREAALREYEKGYKFNSNHARSRLKISELLAKAGRLKEAGKHLDFLMTHTALLSPPDLARAYFLHAQLSQLYQKFDVAMGDMERAVKLDRENHDYQLELYTLRAKAGDSTIKGVQQEARMYYFLSEGEKHLRLGAYHEALVQYLLAREASPKAALPPLKIGEMFERQHDLSNAVENYKLAAERAPRSIEVWSKYIHALIQSYEWEEATKAMDKFRALPVPQSAIDKAAADLMAKQGRHAEAQMFYKKAMAREIVDPDTYLEYAKSLMATKNYKEAPFFFALTLRFDPLNMDAIIGTAKCIAASESIDRAITMLQDELNKSSKARAELLAAIAELYIQKGAWEAAQQNIDQARAADPDYAYAWKLQGQVYMNGEGSDKNALEKALLAYQSFNERNPSDATGYLERYNIFLKKAEFEKASEELNKIYAIYPKYPNFHFYKGFLYGLQGNHRVAADEYIKELKNNPRGVRTLIALGKELIENGQIAGPGGAQERFNTAMQIQPTNAEAKQFAGYAAYLLKNYQAAVALYNSALVFDKANPMIFKRLGMAYREMGDQQQAAIAFRKYLEMEPDAVDRAEFERYR